MTIAIAVKCYLDQCIVMVSDRRVSFEDVVAAADNMMLKELTIGRRWCALFAGDTGPAIPVAQRARGLLATLVPPSANPGDEEYESLAQAKRAVREAYQQEWTELATDEILRPCGLTIDELKRLGHTHLGPEYGVLNKALRSFDLGIELLVCGFDHFGFGHLFMVRNPGRVQSLGQMDYWAIGSGTNMALASLTARPFGLAPVADVVYRACEAKFCAETATGVGPDTTVSVMNNGGMSTKLSTEQVEQIRETWLETRKQRVSGNMAEMIKRQLEDHLIIKRSRL